MNKYKKKIKKIMNLLQIKLKVDTENKGKDKEGKER